MIIKEVGFRPLYHYVCAFELNDKLKEIIKDCPDAAKASHAVMYGYIDPEEGLMLEILGAGKQAPKYFYFKDPYEGERITIKASDVDDVEFMFFPNLEPRFQKKFAPRIEELKKYDASEKLEETRKLGFLDKLRSPQFPDDVKVVFIKDGLKPEEVWVHIIEPGDHEIIGTLLNQPYQDYGVNKGDRIGFNVRETEKKEILCFKAFDDQPRELTREDLDNGSFLKQCVREFLKNTENTEAFSLLLAALRSSRVLMPCDVQLSEEASAIMDKLNKEGKSLDDIDNEKDANIVNSGTQFFPLILTADKHRFVPVFTCEEEIGDHCGDSARVTMPFLHAIDMALDTGNDIEGIVVNPYTDDFILDKELFGTIRKMDPLIDEPDDYESVEGGQNFTNRQDLALAIFVGKLNVFNYALYENDVPPIRGLRIINDTGDPIEGLSIRISSNFNFFKKYEKALPSIPSGKPIDLPDPHLVINGRELAGLTETVNAEILIELCKDGETMCGVRGTMQVLAYDQWQGGESYKDVLAAFVLPNHPLIPVLMHDAAERLQKWGKSASFEGYQAHDPNRVRDLAAAAYAAIQKKNILYAEPPASFSVIGQRIRTPETIMEQRLGTCMDMTLLYAALLEAMGLDPLLVMLKGHIFAGVWLKERSIEELKSSDLIIDNLEQLTMRINNGVDEMTFIECTAMCSDKQVNYEDAEKKAKNENLNSDDFEYAIDIRIARLGGIKPIASRVKDGGEYQIEVTEKKDDELTEAPINLGLTISDFTATKPHKITNKRELWESKLLDLSLHNMLLNVPTNSSVEPIMSSHVDELEDALSDGHEFNLLPVPEWIHDIYMKNIVDGKEEDVEWFSETLKKISAYEMVDWPSNKDFDLKEKFRQDYKNHKLYTFCGEKQLDRELTAIYRAARSSQQENGVSSLYLAVGLLRWFVSPEIQEPCYAPLILMPIEIVRKSANQGYALHARDEEAHFNTTLLEMLKQNFNLEIPGLEPLPTDDHGTNIKKVFSIVRSALFNIKGWDVVETCVIGNFSFAQFAMWNDIHSSGDMLDNSKIVRSLMKGHVDWDVTAASESEDEEVFLPITVDDTQLKAIKMAAHGTTFVLHGPPGTGKSQTITGMIANLMGQGKRVLFVAEKMAALSVVQRRLTSLGIGDFCLELHSDKANKKQVLTQLDRAVAIQHPSRKTEYEECLKKTISAREKIDGYAEHLHMRHNCGYSLRELIALYETVRNVEKFVRFDRDKVGEITNNDIKAHLPLIEQLTAAGEAVVGGILGNKLAGVGLTSYSAEVRSRLRRVAEEYQTSLMAARDAGNKVADVVGSAKPENQADLNAMQSLLKLYQEKKGTEPLLLKLLKTGTTEAYEYFDKVERFRAEETSLLNDWQSDFLKMDMGSILAKHDAAKKKFFGKSGAMAQVTSEVQAYCKMPITFEQIPNMLNAVISYQGKSNELGLAYNSLPDNIKSLLKELPDKEAYSKAYEAACDCQKQAESFPGGLDAIMGISGNPENAKAFDELGKCIERLDLAEKNINELLCREENTNNDNWFDAEYAFCDYLIENPASLKDWGLYNKVRQDCIRVGLEPVINSYENGMSAGELVSAYRKGLYYALINNIIMKDDILSSFSGATFNEAIAQFKKLDDAMLEQTKKEIYYRLASKVPTSFDAPEIGMELNLLRKAIGSNARGMSIRNLFDRIPNILPLLCPCMLMSPNSVAQYLEQKNDMFDVVIFDEASQLPTCKAIGALSRARDAVIVGDPKQMPPTSFFSGGGPEVDDLALDDLDSILDDALALGIPSQHLQWHYRSTHESLIAFSNNQFYDNKMFTFPSANDRERHVTAVHVEGLYKQSTNPKEAEAVVEEIVRRFNDPELNKQSVGVVTFNVKQQTLIENLLAKQFQSNPKLDAWANNGDDPLFVKNLENVQGDERDAILFSIGYGPDEKGHVSNNFGPINKVGGGKRLNVAFSRARVSMTIFSSIYSSDIKVGEDSPDGLVAFRDFLKYAEGNDIRTESNADKQAKLARAGIMQNICKAIENAGFQYMTMVGHSDFHVDIAVVDPTDPSKYIMGIMLDGDGYRQTKNTRDREIAQISVLKNLGWTLCRVWTIDWWDNRDRELKKILGKLEQLKAEAEHILEEKKALEEAQKAEIANREEEARKLKEELEKQAAEVIAEDEEADRERKSAEASRVTNLNENKSEDTVKTDAPVMAEEKPEVTDSTDNQLATLIDELQNAGGKIVDKRENGGALWVIGGKELAAVLKKFKELGVYFMFKAGGGKATGGKDGWWAKTSIELPALGKKLEKTGLKKPSVSMSDTTTEKNEAHADRTVTEDESEKKDDIRPEPTIVEVAPNVEPERKVASASSGKPSELNIVIPDGLTAFYCEGKDYKAAAVKMGVEFVVLKGSKISGTTTSSCPDSVLRAREKNSGIIGTDFVMSDDIKFSSPSGAAAFVAGASRNGYTEWHTVEGTMLKDLR